MAAVVSVAGAVVRKQKQIVTLFRTAGATSLDRATLAAALGVHEGMAFRVLRRHAVLREVGERYYLDEPSWEALRERHRRLAFIIPGFVLLVGIVTLWVILR
jgi:hypothetical protein